VIGQMVKDVALHVKQNYHKIFTIKYVIIIVKLVIVISQKI